MQVSANTKCYTSRFVTAVRLKSDKHKPKRETLEIECISAWVNKREWSALIERTHNFQVTQETSETRSAQRERETCRQKSRGGLPGVEEEPEGLKFNAAYRQLLTKGTHKTLRAFGSNEACGYHGNFKPTVLDPKF